MNRLLPSPGALGHLARLTRPEDVLASVHDLFGDRLVIASALGPQTLVVIDLLHRMGRRVPVHFLDTGLMFPETYALRIRVQHRYDLQVRRVEPERTVAEQAGDEGEALWARDPDRCCALRKVAPLDRLLGSAGVDAWVTGLRRDQGPTRAHTETVTWDAKRGMVKVAPLAWWSRSQVFQYLYAHDVPFNPLLEDGYRSVGCRPCTRPVSLDDDPDDERAGRWSDRGKTECGIHL